MSLRRGAAAVALVVHGIAHLAVYPVSGAVDPAADASRFWVPLSLAHDAGGWTARVLLVVAAASFLVSAHVLAGGPLPVGWSVHAAIGAASSVIAVALLWSGLRPRPEALWVGGLISGGILVGAVVDLLGRRRQTVR